MKAYQKINNYLQRNDISESDLSKMTGIRKNRLHLMLTGEMTISFKAFEKIRHALNTDPNSLIGDRELETSTFKLDMETLENKIYIPVKENERYKRAIVEYQAALKEGNAVEIDNAVGEIETVTTDIVYNKAFNDGIRFIVNAMAGKNVIEI